jgi:hypothetical protein
LGKQFPIAITTIEYEGKIGSRIWRVGITDAGTGAQEAFANERHKCGFCG